jgi:hypothetical protein
LFLARIADLPEFVAINETREHALFAPAEAANLRWVQQNREMYDAALRAIR